MWRHTGNERKTGALARSAECATPPIRHLCERSKRKKRKVEKLFGPASDRAQELRMTLQCLYRFPAYASFYAAATPAWCSGIVCSRTRSPIMLPFSLQLLRFPPSRHICFYKRDFTCSLVYTELEFIVVFLCRPRLHWPLDIILFFLLIHTSVACSMLLTPAVDEIW